MFYFQFNIRQAFGRGRARLRHDVAPPPVATVPPAAAETPLAPSRSPPLPVSMGRGINLAK